MKGKLSGHSGVPSGKFPGKTAENWKLGPGREPPPSPIVIWLWLAIKGLSSGGNYWFLTEKSDQRRTDQDPEEEGEGSNDGMSTADMEGTALFEKQLLAVQMALRDEIADEKRQIGKLLSVLREVERRDWAKNRDSDPLDTGASKI